jgi:AcrR family transcriptional regulator
MKQGGSPLARVTAKKVLETKTGLLEAAKSVLLAEGYGGLTTRNVAAQAGAPMSQIQYHFKSKDGMVLALFEYLNEQLLERQNSMFEDDSLSLPEKWALACDYLDDDLASGYVRVLNELWAVGWSNPEIGLAVRDGVVEWQKLLADLAQEAEQAYGSLGPFTAKEVASLVGCAFIGAEAFVLLGLEDIGMPVRKALRRFGDFMRILDAQAKRTAV